jgi:biotin transport system substrate-specific component
MSNSTSNSLLATLAPLTSNSILRQGALALFGSWMLAGLSQVELVGLVPMTLQTFGVLLIGLTFGGRLAFASLAAYLIQGLIGFPVFAGGGAGIAKLVGPTGGYLVGFLVAATIIGVLADRGFTRSWVGTFVALFVGTATIYAFGLPWLGHLFGYDKMLEFGFTPFVLGDTIKLILAALIGKGVLKGASTFAKL